jgi:peroxiredoxin
MVAAAVLVLAVAGLLYFGLGSGTRARQQVLAPDFTLPQLDGKSLQLSSLRGKVVLLDFWATWCDPCREEIPHFVELQNKYADRGLQIVGISMDDTIDPVRPFAEQFHMNYPIVMGNAKTGELYGGVLGLPITFVIGRDGRIFRKHIGATNVTVFEKEITSLLRE